MIKIVLTLAYDGSNFFGWQRQTLTSQTIQQTIEDALTKLCKEPVVIQGSGRTDSKVHADYQVATFITANSSIPPDRYYLALNRLLPNTIRISNSFAIDLAFDVRRHAIKRTYKYNLASGHYVKPRYRHMVAPAHINLDINRLNQLAKLFVGYHDFTAFCSTKDENETKTRYIYSCYFYANNDFITLKIDGNAFLMNMVRSIVGTVIFYHDRCDGEAKIREAITTKNRKLAGSTAKAEALSLVNVEYNDEWKKFFS